MASKHFVLACLLATSRLAHSQTTTAPPTSTSSIEVPTAVSECHAHGDTQFCFHGTAEYEVLTAPTATPAPEAYSDCHLHGFEIFCFTEDGGEVEIVPEGAEEEHDHGEEEHDHAEEEVLTCAPEEQDCHFHAGIEHCVCPRGEEAAASSANSGSCERTDRDYDVPLRIGLLFVILVTSSIGVFGPILLVRFFRMSAANPVFFVLKQFGTGVIISTAIVHLYTHATLILAQACTKLEYEATSGAIMMAGIFVSFLVEYFLRRAVGGSLGHIDSGSPNGSIGGEPAKDELIVGSDASDKLGVWVMEAGIIFHSIIIGLTLVVAGDSFFLTLFAVILFHQMFEGVALGTRIAGLEVVGTLHKMLMATAFALTTPLGMAIGLGLLSSFNGADPATAIAIGTLDAFSAGVLLWVGLVEMWARDWMYGRRHLSWPLAGCGLAALVAGLALMSLLGKWA